MSTKVGTIGEFDDVKEDFESYTERLECWMLANDVKDEKKKPIFLSLVGSKTYKLLKNLVTPDKPTAKSFDELTKALKDHYKPEPSIIAERYRFNRRSQQMGETISQYAVAIRQLSMTCKFGPFLDDALRDRFVCGLSSEASQKRLLSEKVLDFNSAQELALTLEMASRNTEDFADKTNVKSEEISVNELSAYQLYQKDTGFKKKWSKKPNEERERGYECWRCGGGHSADSCKFKSEKCYNCSKVGHISRRCNQKSRPTAKVSVSTRYVEEEQPQSEIPVEECLGMFTVKSPKVSQEGIQVDVHINNIPLKMQVDTGATVSVVSEKIYESKLSHFTLRKTDILLKTYSGDLIPLLGQMTLPVTYENQIITLPLIVVKGDRPTLMGRNWLKKLKLNWSDIFTIKQSTSVGDILKKHSAVFNPDIGSMTDIKAHINLREGAVPSFHKPRVVPYALREQVNKQLDNLVESGILKKVDYSEWATPIVVVPKSDGGVRICGDYKVTVNRFIEEQTYPLPNVEDIFASLSGKKYFTKLDLTQAYQQLQLDEISKQYLTINTQKGLYQYQRLPYGVSSAPPIFQSAIDQALNGLDGVARYFDDILIGASTQVEHDSLLDQVLDRLESRNMRVKRSKCKFNRPSVDYLGHIIDEEGIHPTDEKVTAIMDAPQPSNVSELKSYLGLLNYYNRFLENLSTLLHPLHELLRADHSWKWTAECEEAFCNSKTLLLTNKNLLVHYDTKKPLRLACDASAYGLGAVISHVMPNGEERPIAFASRTLSSSEKAYAQVEKEALGIIFGVKRFHKYLYGRKFTLMTDHKPLVTIFGPKSGIPTLAAARMQRWALILQAYQYDIEYRRSDDHGNADALSRLPIKTDSETEEPNIFYFTYANQLPVSARDIAESTRKDIVLSKVLDFSMNGWPNFNKEDSLKPYFQRKTELSVEQGCVLWGLRVVIPEFYQAQLLNELHEQHHGICRMKSLARSYLWWPGLDSDVESLVQSCDICQTMKNSPPVAPLHPWKWATRVWQRIHVDFAQKDGEHFFVVIDSHSKWIEVEHMRSTTAEKTIEVLRKMFSAYGLAEELVSDNGPQFSSSEFQLFLKQNGIKHTLVPPYHPASNGAAERTVQIVKKALMAQVLSVQTHSRQLSLEHRLANFLLMYRSTPHTVTGCSPAELFMKRQLRNRFTLLKPHLGNTVQNKQQEMKRHHDNARVKERSFVVGEPVRVRNFRGGKEKWLPGVIAKVCGPRTYVVKVGPKMRFVHVDHLLWGRDVTSESASDNSTDINLHGSRPNNIQHRPSIIPPSRISFKNEPQSNSDIVTEISDDEGSISEDDNMIVPPITSHSSLNEKDSEVISENRYPVRVRRAPEKLSL